MISKNLIICTILFLSVSFAYAVQQEPKINSSAAIWDQQDKESKVKIISATIEVFRRQGVVIKKEPQFYVEEINWAREQTPEMFVKGIGVIFKAVAIMYRDFDNGEDPEKLIQSIMSKEDYGDYLLKDGRVEYEKVYLDWKERN